MHLGQSHPGTPVSIAGLFTGMGMAEGGPVTAGVPYVVGESGPEMFIPAQSGSIAPNTGAGAGGGNTTIYNTIQINDTLQNAARAVAAEIMRTAKAGRKFAS